jgi:hypothetical protein
MKSRYIFHWNALKFIAFQWISVKKNWIKFFNEICENKFSDNQWNFSVLCKKLKLKMSHANFPWIFPKIDDNRYLFSIVLINIEIYHKILIRDILNNFSDISVTYSETFSMFLVELS